MWSFLLGCSAPNHFVSLSCFRAPLLWAPSSQELLVGVLRNICRFEGAIWQGWEKLSGEEIS